MSITVKNIQEVKETSTTARVSTPAQQQTFNYSIGAPADSLITKTLWSDTTKGLLLDLTEKLGIKKYSPSILRDDNTAIAKAQTHLIDLMKYYEGDKNYYYEAITTPYKDKFGTYTCGFGELTNKRMSQEQAYEKMCSKLETYSKEVKNLLNKRIAKDTYENLPSSIKEGLIDLCYNKGLGKISSNEALMNAIKNKDYSTVVKNLAYVYSGKKDAEKVEDAGLYKRSLNRAILAARDLTGKELTQAKAEIDTLYSKAKKCHTENKISTTELDKIYGQYKNGKITSDAKSAESYKFTIDNSFKDKGLLAVAQSLYKSVGNSNVTFEEFFNELKRINNNPETIKIGDELKIPYIKDAKLGSISIQTPVEIKTETNETKPDTVQVEAKTSDKPKEKSFWKKIVGGVKKFFSAIGRFFSNLFSRKKEDNTETEAEKEQTPFQKMLDNGAEVKQDGDICIVSQDYTIQKGDNLWNLARQYGTSEEIICNDNRIPDKNKIQAGQKIKIQKLGYKVQAGDNLTQIAKKFGLTVEMLKDINNIEDANSIEKDQMLEIPGFIYNIEPKDNLTLISKRVGVSVEDLKQLNGLTSDIIQPGQQIKVVYNNGFYSVSEDRRSITVDQTSHEVIETIDMTKVVGKKRKYIQKARIVNGQVAATREVFQPTKSGKLSGKTIIVNAGHGYKQGGIDEGTAGRGGLEAEWLLNYDNAMHLKDRLCAQGAKVIFLQGREKVIPLISNEVNKAENKADMFISIHVNSSPASEIKDRMEIYYHRDFSPKLAQTFEEEMDKFTGRPKYAEAKQAGHQVLRTAGRNKMPGLLWEVAFMNSKEGRKRLRSEKTMNQYSDVLCNSIVKYFENNKNK